MITVSCGRCSKEFLLRSNAEEVYNKDGFCSKCRGRKKYLKQIKEDPVRYRNGNNCVDCNKVITDTATRCHSCHTIRINKARITTRTGIPKVCLTCGASIVGRAKTNLCHSCYFIVKRFNRKGYTYRDVYTSKEYHDWRHSVFKRDEYTCQMCGQKGGILNAHHIIPKKVDFSLVFEINNGITLCRKDHVTTYQKEESMQGHFQELIKGMKGNKGHDCNRKN